MGFLVFGLTFSSLYIFSTSQSTFLPVSHDICDDFPSSPALMISICFSWVVLSFFSSYIIHLLHYFLHGLNGQRRDLVWSWNCTFDYNVEGVAAIDVVCSGSLIINYSPSVHSHQTAEISSPLEEGLIHIHYLHKVVVPCTVKSMLTSGYVCTG